MKSITTFSFLLILSLALSAQESYDVLVYGGTPGGVIAAVAASREGSKVLLVEQTNHVGGLNTSGIGTAESEHTIEETFSGLPLEFYKRVRDVYGPGHKLFYFESHVAEKVFNDLLEEAKVEVIYGGFVKKAVKKATSIQEITLTNGAKYKAKVFINATYEGDLMAKSGVSYTYGRESREQYKESYAGVRFMDERVNASPYDDNGKLMPGFVEKSTLTEGQADKRVMNYNFRLIMSTKDDRVKFQKPDNYDPKSYILLSRFLRNNPNTTFSDLIDFYSWQYPEGKYETNNKQKSVISLGYFGGNVDYPDADYSKRRKIYQAHKDWTMGFLYFLSADASVPQVLRAEVNRYGQIGRAHV